jgi:D-aminopeptidase
VLVQTNYGGTLTINGAPVGRELAVKKQDEQVEGSCMIVVATDAPLLHRNLKRLAKRATLALARTGSVMSGGSGDYVIAFSSSQSLRLRAGSSKKNLPKELANSKMTPLFAAVIEATEEAIYNSLFRATTMTGKDGHKVEALPIDKVIDICRKYGVLNRNKTLLRN